MKCPFCDNNMLHGTVRVDGREGVYFIRDDKKKLSIGDLVHGVGSLKNLDKKFGHIKMNANYCRPCQKIIIDAEVGE